MVDSLTESLHIKDQLQIQMVVQTFFRILSGKTNEDRDWDRLEQLFAGKAQLVPFRIRGSKVSLKIYSIHAFIQRLKGLLSRSNLFQYGYQTVYRCAGNSVLACCFFEAIEDSKFRTRLKKGCHLIQLSRHEEIWRIEHMVWEDDQLA